MFKIKDRVKTSRGDGEIVSYQKSSYSNKVLFYCIKLDNSSEEYLCPFDDLEKLPLTYEKP